MDTIVDLVTGVFRGEAVDRVSSYLGESRATTERGLTQAIPLVVAGFAARGQSEQGAQDLMNGIRDGRYPTTDPSDFGSILSDSSATQHLAQSSDGFMNGFFGGKLSQLVEMISGPSGMGRSSASALIGLVSPLILGWIGKQVTARGLDSSGLSQLLANEGQKVASRLPAGVHSPFENAGVAEAGSRARAASSLAHADRHEPHRGSRWLLAGILGLGALLLWWAFRRPETTDLQTRTPHVDVAQPRVGGPEPVRPAAPDVAPPQPVERQPVAGKDIVTLRDDANALATFLAGSSPVPQRFVLDHIEFDAGSARVAPNAMLDGAAKAILEHPNAKVRIEGHTDRQGNGDDNQVLSRRRADAVKSYLVAKGVPEKQLSAAGMSEHHPLADDETAQGRAQNRRVELIVTQR